MDLFLALNATTVENKILKGVKSIIQNLSDTPTQWLNILNNYFKKAKKKWTIGIKGMALELIPENQPDIPENILEAFNALEHVLARKKQKAVIFIDEFQEINKLDESAAIEGAIRHFAQEAKHLIFVFSGSNRHMLVRMFADDSRPLYQLCDRICMAKIF